MLELNADFNQRTRVFDRDNPWRTSPSAGVERKMLDRIGDEVARATTIVRFAPDSAFAPHTHDGGEEYIVLDGVFQDESGDFPVGSYVRNPPTSAHTPRSEPGATIFVKLWQFDPADRTHVNIRMDEAPAAPDPHRKDVKVAPLFSDHREIVQREDWAPDAEHALDAEGGAEILILKGTLSEGGENFTARDWLRLPVGAATKLKAGAGGATLWVKKGHMRYAAAPDFNQATS